MPTTLWSDDFESAALLSADYTLDGTPTKAGSAAKNGSQGLLTTDEFDGIIKILGLQGSEGSTGFWIRPRHRSVFGYSIFEVRRVSYAVSIYTYTDGKIEVFSPFVGGGATPIVSSAAGALPTETWKFVRVDWKLTPTAAPIAESYVKVYVGDSTSPSLLLDTGLIDSFRSTNAEWDRGFLSPKGDADDWALYDGPPPIIPSSPCPPGYRVFPIADLENQGWTGASWSLVNEPVIDDGSFTQSPAAPLFGQARWVIQLAPSRNPGDLACYVLRYRLRKSAAGGSDLNVTVRLWQGGPNGLLIAEWTHEDLSETFQTFEQTLTEDQAALISDFGNLVVEFDPYQG